MRSARYSDLMRPTGLDSDVFKFHLRKLVKQRIIEKNDNGSYCLSAAGKELANRFDYEQGVAIRQPKLTTITIIRRKNGDKQEHLFHRRARHPYFGYWGVLGGAVAWGESFETAAYRGTKLRTGLEIENPRLSGYYRQRDFDKATGVVLEDKLFVVFVVDSYSGDLQTETKYGSNRWRVPSEVASEQKHFKACLEMINRTDSALYSLADDSQYLSDEY